MRDVTVILNVWRRNYLNEQLESLVAQSLRPDLVWIVQYEAHLDIKEIIEKFKDVITIEHIDCSYNLKYFGRFAIANFVKSRYVWLLDDDIIPGKKWIEYSIQLLEEFNCLVSCAGRIIPNGDFRPEETFDIKRFVGDCSGEPIYFNSTHVFVDFGIQSYFLKKEWLKYFWGIYPFTFETGEDIHLSASLKLNGIRCMVPMQTDEERSGNLNKTYGSDEHASWTKPGFINTREACLKYLIQEKGWTPLNWYTQGERVELQIATS